MELLVNVEEREQYLYHIVSANLWDSDLTRLLAHVMDGRPWPWPDDQMGEKSLLLAATARNNNGIWISLQASKGQKQWLQQQGIQ